MIVSSIIGRNLILEEAAKLIDLANSLDQTFIDACNIINSAKSHVIITGMGKSGHIANKIAATLSSTGTPAFFVHPAEASHGDLGMITNSNVVIAISNSGESRELFDILEYCKRNGIPVIGITAKKGSTLYNYSTIGLVIPLEKEACPLNLAPTSSTTMSLALGDAIAITLLNHKRFSKTDFSKYHPGGKLGKQLVTVADVYRPIASVAWSYSTDTIKDIIIKISANLGGCAVIVDNNKKLLGIVTDGDLRRNLTALNLDSAVSTIMSKNPSTTKCSVLAADILHQMNTHRFTAMPVLNDENQVLGLIHIHDLLNLGLS